MKPIKSRKSSSSKISTRNRRTKIPKWKTYDNDVYEEEDDDDERRQSSVNYTESINSASFPNSPETRSSNLASNPLIIDRFVSIAPFPIFKGTNEECPFIHLSRFLKVCRANNVSSIQTMTRIFPVTLEGEAALWFDLNVEPYPFLSWEEIKSSFLEAYQKTNYDEQLMATKQGDNESVRSYFLRLQWILKIWPDHGLTEDLIRRVFVDGLKDDFRDWIAGKRPNSVHDALRMAFDWERERSVRKGNVGGDCEIMGKMRGLGLKSQCQCSKHQCGKKRVERSDSILSAKSINLS